MTAIHGGSPAPHVTHDGYVIPRGPGPVVLIVSPVRNAPSETFIKAQIEGLPTRVEVLFGDPAHFEDAAGKRLTPRWARAIRRVLQEVVGPDRATRIDTFWLERFLKKRRVKLVLAVYGPTGASLLEMCQRNSIPLVTEFLGFDAYEKAVVDGMRAAYGRLLAEETATIAVSHEIERRLYLIGARPGSVHRIPCGVDVDRPNGCPT